MNKQQELLKELEYHIEKAVGDYKMKLQNIETQKPIKPGYEWLKQGVKYWFMDSGAYVCCAIYGDSPRADLYRLNRNNVFQTGAEAQRFRDIETKIFEIQNKNPVDWEDEEQGKYSPYYHLDKRELNGTEVNYKMKLSNNNHYSSDLNFIKEIKQSLSSDDIDFYFRRV